MHLVTGDRTTGRTWAMLALAIGVGAALRSIAIGREALWGDEALTLMLVRLPAFDLLFRPADPTPGLYYILHQWIVPEHAGAALARLPAWIAGVLTIPAGFWLGKGAMNSRAGLAVAALIATSPALIDYSQEARAYSLLVLLITMSAAALIDAFPPHSKSAPERVRWGRFGLFVVTGVLGIYTHLVGWFWLMPALLLALANINRRNGASRLQMAMGTVAVAALLFPEVNRVAGYALSISNEFNWLHQATAIQFIQILEAVLLPFSGSLSMWWLPIALIATLTIARNVALLIWLYLALRPNLAKVRNAVRRHSVAAWVIVIMLSIPLIGWLAGFLITPVIMIRTALPAAPGFFLALAALAHLKGQGRAIVILVAAFVISSVAGGLVRSKEPWAEVARIVAAQPSSQHLLLFCPAWRAPAFLLAAEQLRLGGPTVVLFKHGAARRVSVNLGRDPHWRDRYVHLSMKPAIPAYRSTPAAGQTVQFSPIPAGIIIVTHECPDVERKAMMAWLGRGTITQPGDGSIKLEMFRPADRRPRPVIVD